MTTVPTTHKSSLPSTDVLYISNKNMQITAKDYLETALVAMPGVGPSVESKNAIRESIRSLFPDRDCATLVRPLTDENKLAVLDIVPREQLRPEFRQVRSNPEGGVIDGHV